jgi:hypothetical protein
VTLQPEGAETENVLPVPAIHDNEKVRVSRLSSGFTSIRELISYALGAGALVYGLEFSAPDRAYLAVGAGLALLGAPIVGNIFEKKGNSAP